MLVLVEAVEQAALSACGSGRLRVVSLRLPEYRGSRNFRTRFLTGPRDPRNGCKCLNGECRL